MTSFFFESYRVLLLKCYLSAETDITFNNLQKI